MTQKPTKRSHTVQKAYLKQFSTNPKEGNPKVKVYDKKRDKLFIASVQDVTVENHFYKIPLEFVEGFVKKFPEYKDFFKTDFVEEYFNKNFEIPYVNMINEFFSKRYAPNDRLDYIPFKVVFSLYITIQYLRTRNKRKTLEDYFSSFEIEKEYQPLIHFIILLNDKDKLKSFGNSLYDRLWKIYVNETSIPFKTSDNPVVVAENGEIAFPFSSKYLIVISNSIFNENNIEEDLTLESMIDRDSVKYYNRLQEEQCEFQTIWEEDVNAPLC
ncbi:DUF4238 domain-containing protein [Paenisporosarcina sp. NPDC076898]|uniref:DUF4238 domain-containing protein n=1 Tax=unclassified Paenisporosarcina TaxID=2642018 RepID=UPI003CFD47DE